MAEPSKDVQEAPEVAEKIVLAEQIWDSIAREQEAVGVSQAQKDELDRRLES
jgi:putative addiction module component (TIGR02574 family)